MATNNHNNFNFLRFSLALMVLLSHAPELIDGNRSRELLSRAFRDNFSFGEIAVGGFFMLSGFLICKSWHDSLNPLAFLDKRIRRIFPAFITASIISAVVVGPLGAQSAANYFSEFQPINFLLSAIFLQQPVIPEVFVGQPYPHVNGAMWTIPIEFSCYLGILIFGIFRGFKPLVCFLITTLWHWLQSKTLAIFLNGWFHYTRT